jgi:hypothetical protein
MCFSRKSFGLKTQIPGLDLPPFRRMRLSEMLRAADMRAKRLHGQTISPVIRLVVCRIRAVRRGTAQNQKAPLAERLSFFIRVARESKPANKTHSE